MRRAGQGAAARLARALCGVIAAEVTVEAIASRSWSSITFAGERHQLRLHVTGAEAVAAAKAFRSALAELELDIPGHVLIDLAVASEATDDEDGSIRLDVEALTVEAA